MKDYGPPTPVGEQIGQMNFQGNITPRSWYEHVGYDTPKRGWKPDLLAITILGEIIYWGKLHYSYQSYADQFGVSKRAATDACKRLRDLGLVTLELRHIKTPGGLHISNVLHIEPIPEKIIRITHEVDMQDTEKRG